ncbi:probable serine/threonine-protein kinase irlF [Rhopalosiphum maidis]|uniref:probable serine/threonine-protein kinase irlF n=1 Tax=Rhopalosiphum maidis TaxID=43146 RepID=UPI000EFFD629|nr:probable serine/threonine-protein kinase irlF [Rhopalosiphum maidis]
MEVQSNNDESRPGATLPGVVGHQETAVGGGSLQRSTSASQNRNEGMPSMALSSGNTTTAETFVTTVTRRNQALQGDSDTDTTKTPPGKLATRLAEAATTKDKAEGNAQFHKCLEAVYDTSKKLENEVTIATNTKKEIKALVTKLATATKGLIHWARVTGRVKTQTISRSCQAGTTVQHECNATQTDEKELAQAEPRHQGSELTRALQQRLQRQVGQQQQRQWQIGEEEQRPQQQAKQQRKIQSERQQPRQEKSQQPQQQQNQRENGPAQQQQSRKDSQERQQQQLQPSEQIETEEEDGQWTTVTNKKKPKRKKRKRKRGEEKSAETEEKIA